MRPGKILTPNGFPYVICRQRSLLIELETNETKRLISSFLNISLDPL